MSFEKAKNKHLKTPENQIWEGRGRRGKREKWGEGKGEGAPQNSKTKVQDSIPVSLFLLSQSSNLKPPHLNSQISSFTKLKISNLKPLILNPELSNLKSQNLKSQITRGGRHEP